MEEKQREAGVEKQSWVFQSFDFQNFGDLTLLLVPVTGRPLTLCCLGVGTML